MDGTEPGPHGREPVGSLAEEATKLVDALHEWAKGNGTEYGDAAATAMRGAAAAAGSVNEHVATGGADCRYCPLCRVIHVVRDTNPEVRSHLSEAASSLLQAAAALLATPVHDPQPRRHGPAPPVERIDLDDDADWGDG